MAFTFKQALDFNTFTIGLAAAGLAYAATIGSEAPAGATPSSPVKWISTLAIVFFGGSVLFGTFVMGRASKIPARDDQTIDDELMKAWGRAHSAALCLGLLFAAALMLNHIWKWF